MAPNLIRFLARKRNMYRDFLQFILVKKKKKSCYKYLFSFNIKSVEEGTKIILGDLTMITTIMDLMLTSRIILEVEVVADIIKAGVKEK